MANNKHVYHVCGSPTSEFFHELSLIYAKNTILPKGWKEDFIVIEPSGSWRTGHSLSQLSDARASKEIINDLHKGSFIVPHLFCYEGMTACRDFFEKKLSFKMIGSPGSVMALAADKNRTRQCVVQNGVNIADGGLTSEIDVQLLSFPIIIKPNKQDNSVGLTMVTRPNELQRAIELAEASDISVLAEKYIHGREIRVAVLETSKGYLIPPIIEYLVTPQNPIRTTSDKLEIDTMGKPQDQALSTPVKMVCPADIDCDLYEEIRSQALSAHKALGARHYSLFDFRIEHGSNRPFFLEAGLFWSFSNAAMITKMLRAGSMDIPSIIKDVWECSDFVGEH